MEEELTDMRKTVWEVFPIPFCKKKNQKTMSKTWNSSSAEMRKLPPNAWSTWPVILSASVTILL